LVCFWHNQTWFRMVAWTIICWKWTCIG